MLMSIMKIYVKIGFFLLIALIGFSAKDAPEQNSFDKKELLERHNYYRQKVGVPNLEWSEELAEVAQKWANQLAKKCEMKHSNSRFGENIYWTSGTANATEAVDFWASEERFFNHRNTTYVKGKGLKSGHYSQVIWKNTTHVGGAVSTCTHGGEIWVCNYNPHGNIVGQKAY